MPRSYLGLMKFVVLLAVSYLLHNAPVLLAQSAMESMRVYDAAYDQWLDEVSFKCTYDIRAGESASLEDALNERLAKDSVRSSGVLIKSADLLRYSKVFEGGVVKLDSNQEANRSFDVLVKPEVELRIDEDNRMMLLSSRPVTNNRQMSFGIYGKGDVTPLTVFSAGEFQSPFRHVLYNPLFKITNSSVRKIDDSHVDVSYCCTLAGGEEVTETTVRLLNSSKLPVIEMIDRETKNMKTDYRFESHTNVKEFRDVGGHLAAKKIIHAVLIDDGAKRSAWKVCIWSSKDLGIDTPVASDFIVKVPPVYIVRNVVGFPQLSSDVRNIDFGQLKRSSVENDGEDQSGDISDSSFFLRSAALSLVVVGAIYAAVKIWTRYRS